jgi:hypothetical protein
VKGEVRDIKVINKADGSKWIVYLVNDDYPKAYRLKAQITNHK